MESPKMVAPNKPHFFKPFLPGSDRQLQIPAAFFRHIKGQCCDSVHLRDANGKLWHVKVHERKLQDGWGEFVSEHGLQVGNFLVFRHEGDMLFDVMVFDNTLCEKLYPSSTLSQLHVINHNHKTKPTTCDISKTSLSISNPHFTSKLHSTRYGKPGDVLTVPITFARTNGLTRKSCDMMVEDERGKLWPMSLRPKPGRVNIEKGWGRFVEAKDLKPGDAVILELVRNGMKILMKFHGLQKAKEAPNAVADPLIKKKQPSLDITTASLSVRNPYFVAPIFESTCKKHMLNVPSEFARLNGLTEKRCDMILEDEGGKLWPMFLRPSKYRVNIGNGWFSFHKAQGLKAGDAVTLELLKNGEKPVMKCRGIIRL